MNWRDPWANLSEYRDPAERRAEIVKKAHSIQDQSTNTRYEHTIGWALALELAESWVWQAEQARFYKALCGLRDLEDRRKKVAS